MAAQRNDQVFQLSLTEIALCITFILLLLLGSMVARERQAREQAQQALAQARSVEEMTPQLERARAALEEQLREAGVGAVAAGDVITKLVQAQQARDERDRLRKQLEDQNARLTALTELLPQMASASGTQTDKAEIVDALMLQAALRKALDVSAAQDQSARSADSADTHMTNGDGAALRAAAVQAIASRQALRTQLKAKLALEPAAADEAQAIAAVVDAASRDSALRNANANGGAAPPLEKENADLRGQLAFFKARLNARGGRDYPPCWADPGGRVEFLFAIELRADGLALTPAWPAGRAADALALPGVAALVAEKQSYGQFPASVQGIHQWSQAQNPPCRHYVQLASTIADAVQSDRARLVVENHFYKFELRR